MAFFEIDQLTHVYEPRGHPPIPALTDVDLQVQAGEYIAVVGANGSGKTTLARHLNALLLPTAGEVWVDGQNTRDSQAKWSIRAKVGMVFQSPADQMVGTVVLEDVAFGPENLGLPRNELTEAVRSALERVGMWDERDRPPHMLSAGQQQRVAIAAALAMQPRCLVLDEATAMLDPAGRRDVLDILDGLNSAGLTLVSITHSMHEAVRAQRIVVMHQGQVALDGSPRAVLSAPQISAYGLVPPPAAQLAARLGRRFPALGRDLLEPGELADALAQVCDTESKCENLAGDTALRPDEAVPPYSPPLIRASRLHHTYMRGTPLAQPSLRGVDLDLGNQVIALIGATGSGKSTLMQHLNGLLRPQCGEVWVMGENLSSPDTDLRQIRRAVGLVFQRPEEQLFEQYVGDDIAYGPRLMGVKGRELRDRVSWAMEKVGLNFEGYEDRLVSTLSGGERRKAGLAGILALRPRVLLLDEPTSGLDPRARIDLLAMLSRLHDDENVALLIATHNMEDVANLSDRVYVLGRGRVVLEGSTRSVFSRREQLDALGLEVPPLFELMTALRQRGFDVPEGAMTVDEAETAILSALGRARQGDEP